MLRRRRVASTARKHRCTAQACSELEVEAFADAERLYVKENVVFVSDDADAYLSPGGIPPLRVARVTARVLLGETLPPDELLKTSGSKLEVILREEGAAMDVLDTPSAKQKPPAKTPSSTDDTLADVLKAAATSPVSRAPSPPEDDEVKPYASDNELEYLSELFEVVALHVRLASATIKSNIKEQSGTTRTWYAQEEGNKAGARELKAKLRVAQTKVSRRCSVSTKPRLLQLATKLGLDEWETKVVALLVGRTISPAVKSLMDGMESGSAVQRLDDSTTVGALLSIFCPEGFADQVSHRRRFYKGATLVRRGVVRLQRSRWHSSGSADLTEQRVELDRRVLDFVVGLDTEIDELVEGSELYAPTTHLEDVVLPKKKKSQLVELCAAFFDLADHAKRTGLFDRAVPYGNGFVVLLCGPSGTGKTMTVHGDKAASFVRRRRDTPPSDEAVGGLVFDFELFRTASGPSRLVRESESDDGVFATSRPLIQRRRRARAQETSAPSRLRFPKRQAPPGRRRCGCGSTRFVSRGGDERCCLIFRRVRGSISDAGPRRRR